MDKEISNSKSFYFSTRDLLVMAVLAALGGVTSTYVNAIGDAMLAALGFAGATQWAAGLHTIWVVLAMGILRKTGAGTLTGIIKGVVELMSGNTHGVIILLVNLVAGLLVDLGFFLFKDKRSIVPYLVAGGLSAASNVVIFQFFATLPSNILAIGAILFLTIVAGVSGVVFSGIMPYLLVNMLVKANVVKLPEKSIQNRKVGWYIILGVFIIASLLTIYLRSALKGSPTVNITGAVEAPYHFPHKELVLNQVDRQMELRGVHTAYTGYPMLEVINFAQPFPAANTILIEAADGYAFLISFDELLNNPNILLVPQGQGKNTSFDVVGPNSSKAWVRNVVELTVSVAQGLDIHTPSGEVNIFNPEDWLQDMDSTQIALPDGSQKLQGVPLWKIVEPLVSEETQISIVLHAPESSLVYDWIEIKENDKLRVFTIIEDEGYSFVFATISGEVLLFPLERIEIK